MTGSLFDFVSGRTTYPGGGGDFSDGGEAGGAARTIGNTDAFPFGILTDDVERLTIDASGNVGVGVSSPRGLLHVQRSDTTAVPSVLANTFVVEDNAHVGMTIMGREGGFRTSLYFGTITDTASALLELVASTGVFTIGNQRAGGITRIITGTGAEAFRLNADGDVETISIPRGNINITDNAVGETTVNATPRILETWENDGVSAVLVATATNDYIQVPSAVAGDYLCHFSASFSGTINSTIYLEFYIFDDSISTWVATGIRTARVLGAGGDTGSVGLSHLLTFDADDRLAVYQYSPDASALTIEEASLTMVKIG